MKEVEVKIEGVSPLLMHRFSEEKKEDKSKVVTGAGDYSNDAEMALYKLPDGTIYTPATHIEGALMKAASNFQIVGKGKKTYKDLAKSALFVTPDAIAHLQPVWVEDKRAVVVPSTRGRVVRSRPRFDAWSLKFTIKILDKQFPKEVVKQILDYAGNNVGIGDFRPRFGRFMVTEFKELIDHDQKGDSVDHKAARTK